MVLQGQGLRQWDIRARSQRNEDGMMAAMRGETQSWGDGAVGRWVDLLDRAEALMREGDLNDPCAQRTAARAITSLFLFEHQMTGRARRRAREYMWLRDRPDVPLPQASIRREWKRCRCRICRVERVLGRSGIVPQAA
jgi:hypothetical protein